MEAQRAQVQQQQAQQQQQQQHGAAGVTRIGGSRRTSASLLAMLRGIRSSGDVGHEQRGTTLEAVSSGGSSGGGSGGCFSDSDTEHAIDAGGTGVAAAAAAAVAAAAEADAAVDRVLAGLTGTGASIKACAAQLLEVCGIKQQQQQDQQQQQQERDNQAARDSARRLIARILARMEGCVCGWVGAFCPTYQ